MDRAAEPASRSVFLDALDRLHERFLVGVEGVTELWLVRHGDAYAELVSLDDSNIDPPLSEKGRREARLLGDRMEVAGITGVWASGIRRAVETAEIASGRLGLSVTVDPRLREVKTHWEDRAATGEPDNSAGYIPFVEPVAEVIERMDGAVRDIARVAGPGARVAVVTHAGAIGFYLGHLLKLELGALKVLPQFTSVTVLLFKDERVVVQSIADISHLAVLQSGA